MSARLRIPFPVLPPAPASLMHKRPCKNCPSAHFPPDPEAADLLKAPREVQVQAAFPCAWAPPRSCRGYCDRAGVTNDDLRRVNEVRYGQ